MTKLIGPAHANIGNSKPTRDRTQNSGALRGACLLHTGAIARAVDGGASEQFLPYLSANRGIMILYITLYTDCATTATGVRRSTVPVNRRAKQGDNLSVSATVRDAVIRRAAAHIMTLLRRE
eukprot:6184839-Pleurochrysis_carterae.AAC.5